MVVARCKFFDQDTAWNPPYVAPRERSSTKVDGRWALGALGHMPPCKLQGRRPGRSGRRIGSIRDPGTSVIRALGYAIPGTWYVLMLSPIIVVWFRCVVRRVSDGRRDFGATVKLPRARAGIKRPVLKPAMMYRRNTRDLVSPGRSSCA